MHVPVAAAVESREFFRVDFDQAIVDFQATERGHQVFDHLEFGRAAFQVGSQTGVDTMVDIGRTLVVSRQDQIAPSGHRSPWRRDGSRLSPARPLQ